jgi:hypothetical protein
MLEIIGLAVCLCLFVKGMELSGQKENAPGRYGGGIAIIGSLVFAALIWGQASATSSALSGFSTSTDYTGKNVMSTDENLTTTDMNATDMNMTVEPTDVSKKY